MSDEAAVWVGQHQGNLHLGLTTLTGAAANSLSQSTGRWLYLSFLKDLPDDAAKALSQYQGSLMLPSLTRISDEAAVAFSGQPGHLFLSDVTTLSDRGAAALRDHNDLYISLQDLPASAAEILRQAGHK